MAHPQPTGAPGPDPGALHMYSDLADWFHLITIPEDYQEEAADIHRLIQQYARQHQPRTLLELGSGGGNNASHLKAHYQMTLVDLSPDMLRNSQALNPACEHLQGDMRSLRLEQVFDAVLIHDAIMYMLNEDDLSTAVKTAAIHLKPGGVAVFVPDDIKETFQPSVRHGGHDGPDGRSIRYLEWSYDPDPADTWYLTDYAYLLRQSGQPTRCYNDQHTVGLFSRAVWMQILQQNGFDPHRFTDQYKRELFIGVKQEEA